MRQAREFARAILDGSRPSLRNAAAELTTYYYTILRVDLTGLEGIKEIAEDARIEDRNYFEALVPRIYEFGGGLPKSMVDFHNCSASRRSERRAGALRRACTSIHGEELLEACALRGDCRLSRV